MKKRNILFLAPSLIGFSALNLVPFLWSFYYAFIENAFTKKFVGFDNFVLLFQNGNFRLAMKNTLYFTAISVPLSMLVSAALAMGAVKYCRRLPLVKSMFFLPVLLPSASIVSVFSGFIGNIPPFWTLMIIYIWKYTGLNIMLLISALSNLDTSVYDAAKIDGAGAVRRTASIVLPMISPTLFFTFVLSVVNSLKIYRESYLLYGDYPDKSVYMLQNYLNNHFMKLNYQNIATAAIFFALIIYTVVALIFNAEKKRSEDL